MSLGEFGPYRLDELLGRGGMGDVYRAFDTRRERFVALKLLKAEMVANPDFEARFRRESKLAAQLHEPHIIPIHDFGEVDGRLYIDMRLVDGPDLATMLRDGPLAPERAVDLVGQVASALDAAHAAGLVHRDVKPSNIMVSGKGDFAYLTDFGIVGTTADPTDPRLTATGAVLGTGAYMAPERFDGLGDHRGDVYALGCVLFEALTGRRPYQGDNLLATMALHMTKPPPRASEYGLPAALDAVLATALATDPGQRYPRAGGLADAAAAALAAPAPAPAPVPPPAVAPAGPAPAPPPVPVAGWSNRPAAGEPPKPPTRPLPEDGRRRHPRLVLGLVVAGLLAAAAVVAVVLLPGAMSRTVTGDGTPVAQAPPAPTATATTTRATTATPTTATVAAPPLDRPPAIANPPRTRAALERYLAEQPAFASPSGPPATACPGDLPAAVGATLVCSVKTPMNDYRVTLTVDPPEDGGVGFHLNTAVA